MKEIKKQRKEENAMEGNKITLIFLQCFFNGLGLTRNPI